MTAIRFKCGDCKHLREPKREDKYVFCDAFPDGTGIPEEILFDDFDHIKPYPGDNGIMFEPTDEYKDDYDKDGNLKD